MKNIKTWIIPVFLSFSLHGIVFASPPICNDPTAVKTSGNQTVAGVKTFTSAITSSVAASSNAISLLQGSLLNLGGPQPISSSAIFSLITDGQAFIGTLSIANTLQSANSAIPLTIQPNRTDGATSIGVVINNSVSLTAVGSKIASYQNNSTEKLAVGKNGQLVAPPGTADAIVGTATLVAGTVTVNTTAVSASSIIFLSTNTPGGTAGIHYAAPTASIVAGTSFVINSVAAAGTTVATDTSTINWWIVN